jgi:hypothetical protein
MDPNTHRVHETTRREERSPTEAWPETLRGNLLRAREAALRLARFSFLRRTWLFGGQRLLSSL